MVDSERIARAALAAYRAAGGDVTGHVAAFHAVRRTLYRVGFTDPAKINEFAWSVANSLNGFSTLGSVESFVFSREGYK